MISASYFLGRILCCAAAHFGGNWRERAIKNFKSQLKIWLGALAALLSASSYGLTIGSAPAIDVGGLDVFVHVSTKNELPNSNPSTEEDWIESVLGFDVDYLAYGNNVPITATNEDATAFAWQLIDNTADYFLIKNAAFWAIYKNEAELGFAVVDADSGLLPEKMNFGDATISHYGVVSGEGGFEPPSEVPVPAPLPLVGLGLLLLGWCRRR